MAITSAPTLMDLTTQPTAPLLQAAVKNDTVENDTVTVCMICFEQQPDTSLIRLPCNDLYCSKCLEQLLMNALMGETSFPPRCCKEVILLEHTREHLKGHLLQQVEEKWEEFTNRTGVYCSTPACSAFIRPADIRNGRAACEKCLAKTCVQCRNAWHEGPCVDGEDGLFHSLKKAEGWQHCPACNRVIEKIDGCNHMECWCGASFCYECCLELDDCTCSE